MQLNNINNSKLINLWYVYHYRYQVLSQLPDAIEKAMAMGILKNEPSEKKRARDLPFIAFLKLDEADMLLEVEQMGEKEKEEIRKRIDDVKNLSDWTVLWNYWCDLSHLIKSYGKDTSVYAIDPCACGCGRKKIVDGQGGIKWRYFK